MNDETLITHRARPGIAAACFVLLVSSCAASKHVTTATSASASPTASPAASVATIHLETPVPSRRPPAATRRAPAAAHRPVSSTPAGAVLAGCPLFPADNAWRRDVSHDPVDPRSTAYIASINSSRTYVHPDFGSNPTYGITYQVVPSTQKKVPITF